MVRLWRLSYTETHPARSGTTKISNVVKFSVEKPYRENLKAKMHHSNVKLEFADVDPQLLEWKPL